MLERDASRALQAADEMADLACAEIDHRSRPRCPFLRGVAALSIDPSVLTEIANQYRLRRDLLLKGLNEIGLHCESPAGAFYAFPDVSRINKDSREAADTLLNHAQVATVPGIVFGPQGESHLRFSFSTSIETIEAGLDSLRRNL